MKKRYKKLYIAALAIFIVINLAAVFFVFKRYRDSNANSKLLSNTKFRFSKVKEKIMDIEVKLSDVRDSSALEKFEEIKLEKIYIDSLLAYDHINIESLSSISTKIYDISARSNQLEQSIDKGGQEVN